jgi:hypothetical protein
MGLPRQSCQCQKEGVTGNDCATFRETFCFELGNEIDHHIRARTRSGFRSLI